MGIERGESDAHAVRPDLRRDSLKHFQSETCAVLDWASVLVVACIVDVGVDKLFK